MNIYGFPYLLSVISLFISLAPSKLQAISMVGKKGGSRSCRVHQAHDRAVIDVELQSIGKILQGLQVEHHAKVVELEKSTQGNATPETLQKLAREMYELAGKIQVKLERRNELHGQLIRQLIGIPRGPLRK